MISLKKIMTRDVVSVKRSTDIFDAIRMMSDGNITGLPVVDEDDKLVGIVTAKDVMRLLLDTQTVEGKVEDCMTTDVISFNENDNVLDVINSLVDHKFRKVPIESKGKLVGIVSRRDIISYIFSLELKDRGELTSAIKGRFS
jgi:CBS domain-containing protein